ncbi:MAG: hypothetical protein JJ866_00560 [Roseibium sp.]|uniref:hypothetical protein n=1 Tax=Roseibium sp. TaxID=1936156 RepID=UPI001B0CD23E|nr:hypothetical protein [Roseibium sp.]MBO6890404.1 hypothetical protein [Roseibium sp.]MBO6929155.1 hypothetical protein [Roseibium sp.]
MISLTEIRAALDGSWLLLLNRPEGLRYFDQSIQGFWRSFQVIILLVPVILVGGVAEKQLYSMTGAYQSEPFTDSAFWSAHFMASGVAWVAFPALVALLAGPVGISHRFVPFIVTWNWSSLLATVPMLVSCLLYLLRIVSTEIFVLLHFASYAALLWFYYRVARNALQSTISLAIGVVVLDVLLSVVIAELIGRVWGL